MIKQNYIFLFCLFCLASLSSCRTYSQKGEIKGKLITEIPEEKALIAYSIQVILKINDLEKTTVVDEHLNFFFQNLQSDSIQITTQPYTYLKNNRIIGFLKPDDTIHLKIPFTLTCKYEFSKENKTCPVCQKQDKVITIIYGLIAESNEEDIGKQDKTYKSGGCITTDCDPNWYCKRDNLEF